MSGINENLKFVEYRVRPVMRWHVTRFTSFDLGGGESGGASSDAFGEYDSADMAYEVGHALCRAEHQNRGFPPGDERMKYPRRPDENMAAFVAWLSNRSPEELFGAEDPQAFWADVVLKAQRCVGAA